jgi:hypothetical protein
MLSRATAATVLATVGAATGCVVKYTSPAELAAQRREVAQVRAQGGLDSTITLLGRAHAALGNESYQEAMEFAHQAKDAIPGDCAKAPWGCKPNPVEAANATIVSIEGMALRGLHRDVDALIVHLRDESALGGCGEMFRDRCNEHRAWLKRTFPNVHALDAGTLPFGFAFTSDLAVLDAESVRNTVQGRSGIIGLRIRPTKRQSTNGGTLLKVEGRDYHDTLEDCNKVGELKVGGNKVDVERCHERAIFSPRANFSVTVPEADAADIEADGKHEVLVLFEAKSFKHTGNVYSAGAARVVSVAPAE